MKIVPRLCVSRPYLLGTHPLADLSAAPKFEHGDDERALPRVQRLHNKDLANLERLGVRVREHAEHTAESWFGKKLETTWNRF